MPLYILHESWSQHESNQYPKNCGQLISESTTQARTCGPAITLCIRMRKVVRGIPMSQIQDAITCHLIVFTSNAIAHHVATHKCEPLIRVTGTWKQTSNSLRINEPASKVILKFFVCNPFQWPMHAAANWRKKRCLQNMMVAHLKMSHFVQVHFEKKLSWISLTEIKRHPKWKKWRYPRRDREQP